MNRIVLVPKGHPLLSTRRPTLRDLANWPIVITWAWAVRGRAVSALARPRVYEPGSSLVW